VRNIWLCLANPGALVTTNCVNRPFKDIAARTNRALCIGSDNCMNIVPKVSQCDDERILAFMQEPDQIDHNNLIDACNVYPVDLLITLDVNVTQIIPPT